MSSSPAASQLPRTQAEPRAEERPSHTEVDQGAEIARLKRRLTASQEEVRELTQGKVKRPPYAHLPPLCLLFALTIRRTTVTMGRAIRRLVSLYESLDDLLQAADDHNVDEDEEDDEEELTEEALEKRQEYAII